MKNVPKLRFKRFSDEWQEQKLDKNIEYVSSGRTKGKSENGKYKVFGSTGIIGYTEKPDYNGEHILIARVGANAGYINKINEECGISDNTLVLKCLCNLNTNFLAYKLHEFNLSRLIFGSGQPLITGSQIKELKFKLPSIKEQEKIANFLINVDKLIEKQGEKVNNLEQYKKGMMQKIFSQEIRFKKDDGGNYLAWNKKKASELFKNISDKNHNGELDVLSVTQDRGVMLRSNLDIDIKFDLESVKNYKRVKPGDFIISLRSFQGGFELTDIEGLISPAYTVFNFKDSSNFNAKYFGYIFKSENFIRKLTGLIYGVRDGKAISFTDFSTMKFEYPCLEEQIRITDFLSKIDSIVEKEKVKLEDLRMWKRGLLQRMFV